MDGIRNITSRFLVEQGTSFQWWKNELVGYSVWFRFWLNVIYSLLFKNQKIFTRSKC